MPAGAEEERRAQQVKQSGIGTELDQLEYAWYIYTRTQQRDEDQSKKPEQKHQANRR
jgi:hypothetical protein